MEIRLSEGGCLNAAVIRGKGEVGVLPLSGFSIWKMIPIPPQRTTGKRLGICDRICFSQAPPCTNRKFPTVAFTSDFGLLRGVGNYDSFKGGGCGKFKPGEKCKIVLLHVGTI